MVTTAAGRTSSGTGGAPGVTGMPDDVDAGAAMPPRAGVGGAAAGGGGAAGDTTQDAACPALAEPSQPPTRLTLSGDLGTHDPALIESEGRYYLFQTGPGIPIKQSSDLRNWQATGSVFSRNPDWISQKVRGATDLWAPDISYFGGLYHLYYAASTPGSNHSCIGHATSTDLTQPFVDRGAVLCSNPSDDQRDDWNAIDPNLIQDERGRPFLAFGSFWGGLKLIALDDTGARADDTSIAIAARPKNGGAIEAPFIVQHCGYYYLFVSFDRCCDGANSTYNVRVGRAQQLTGPYLDQNDVPMLQGGGTPLVAADATWHGPGHNAVIHTRGRSYDVHHAYYAGMNSGMYRRDASYLRISELAWGADGWPVSGGP